MVSGKPSSQGLIALFKGKESQSLGSSQTQNDTWKRAAVTLYLVCQPRSNRQFGVSFSNSDELNDKKNQIAIAWISWHKSCCDICFSLFMIIKKASENPRPPFFVSLWLVNDSKERI